MMWPAGLSLESLWFLCVVLFVDGATIAATSTVLVLTYGRFHPAWQLAVFGALASALGSGVQLLVLRWALSSRQPWMTRFAPSRDKIDAALKNFPSASFLMRHCLMRPSSWWPQSSAIPSGCTRSPRSSGPCRTFMCWP